MILKLMLSERKDIDDVKKILAQTWHRLDRRYLYRRARQAGLERAEEGIEEAWAEMKRRCPVKMIRLVPSLAVPEYMEFLLELCGSVKHTRRGYRSRAPSEDRLSPTLLTANL